MENEPDTALLEKGYKPIATIVTETHVQPTNGHQSQVVAEDAKRRNGVLNQILLTAAIWLTASASGMPIGYSGVLLPQLVLPHEPLNSTAHNLSVPLVGVQNNLIGAPDTETMWMSMEMGSWISSVHSLATPIGSFMSAPFTDRYGRKTALQISIVPLIGSWIMMALSQSHVMIIVARICGGVAVGFMAAPAQIFIAEIAEPHLRGMLIGTPFVAYSLGILLVFVLGWNFSWRVVAWAGVILPLISWVALFFANESPVWLVRNRRKVEAFKSMRWLRDSDELAREEVRELTERFEEDQGQEIDSVWKLLRQRDVIKPLVIVNLFNTFQILSGTLTIVFYAVQIIQEFTSESTAIDGTTAAVFSAISRFFICLFYCFILMTVNRRTMMNWAGTTAGISSFFLGLLILFKHQLGPSVVFPAACALLVVYLAGSTGLFIMCGVGVGELLPSKVRGKISGYIFGYMNIVLFIVIKLFPTVVRHIGIAGIFFSFSMGSFLSSVTMFLMMPETKGRKLTDIENYFRQGRHWIWRPKYQ